LLIPLTGSVGMIVLAFAEWPVHKELGWRRLAGGANDERDLLLAQSHAGDLETRGEWQQAIEVYEAIAQRSATKADFAINNAMRLRSQIEASTIS
jgi:hypothetical protein